MRYVVIIVIVVYIEIFAPLKKKKVIKRHSQHHPSIYYFINNRLSFMFTEITPFQCLIVYPESNVSLDALYIFAFMYTTRQWVLLPTIILLDRCTS